MFNVFLMKVDVLYVFFCEIKSEHWQEPLKTIDFVPWMYKGYSWPFDTEGIQLHVFDCARVEATAFAVLQDVESSIVSNTAHQCNLVHQYSNITNLFASTRNLQGVACWLISIYIGQL